MDVFIYAQAWVMLGLAAFYLNFLVVHLATEMHSHGEEHSHAAETDHGHAPHDVGEHLLDVALKGPDLFQAPVLLVVAENFVLPAPVSYSWSQPLFERERPPGESPLDPEQPRAPPLA